MTTDAFETTLKGCARCGGDHAALTFQGFAKSPIPADDGGPPWTVWATCPSTGEPILGKWKSKESEEVSA